MSPNFFVQKNKYIRGAFNLFNERKIQNKTFYIKDIYGSGIDINFFFDFNNTNINNDDIAINGYIFNYDDIKYIDSYNSLEVILIDYFYFNNAI